jgi:hypothetical protein
VVEKVVSEKVLPPVFGKERKIADVLSQHHLTRVLAFLFAKTADEAYKIKK